MTWSLYLDDLRDPSWTYGSEGSWIVARSTEEAKSLVVSKGMPQVMSLDHDLGGSDQATDFLSWLAREYWDGVQPIPAWQIHSANPVGSANMQSFMDSWKRSLGSQPSTEEKP